MAAIWFEVFDSLCQGGHGDDAIIVFDESLSLCQGSSCVAAIWLEVFDSLCQGRHCEDANVVFEESIALCQGSSCVAEHQHQESDNSTVSG